VTSDSHDQARSRRTCTATLARSRLRALLKAVDVTSQSFPTYAVTARCTRASLFQVTPMLKTKHLRARCFYCLLYESDRARKPCQPSILRLCTISTKDYTFEVLINPLRTVQHTSHDRPGDQQFCTNTIFRKHIARYCKALE
jgi:hypothetical protein